MFTTTTKRLKQNEKQTKHSTERKASRKRNPTWSYSLTSNLTNHRCNRSDSRNGKRKENTLTISTPRSSWRPWWRRRWEGRCLRWKFRRELRWRQTGRRWPACGVAVVVAIPSVLRDTLAKIEFNRLWTFWVDLDGLRDPTVGSIPVDIESADRIIQTLTSDLECVRWTLPQTPWSSYRTA